MDIIHKETNTIISSPNLFFDKERGTYRITSPLDVKKSYYIKVPVVTWEEVKEKKNVFVYIRGNKTRGKEVINILEGIGGRNKYAYNGENVEDVYFIDAFGFINAFPISNWIKNNYTEIKLPNYEPQDKDLVWAYNNDSCFRSLVFYNKRDKGAFNSSGARTYFKFDNYEPYIGEEPDWAKEARKQLEK